MIEARDDAGRGLPASVVAWAEVRVGALHVANCDAAKAREAYERALKLLPQSAFAREHLAEWHAAQGQWRAAGDLFSQLLRARSDPQHHLGLAECLEAQQRPRDAAQEKNRAVDAMAAAERDGARDHLRLLALVRLEDDAHAAEGLRLAQKDWDNRQDALSADTLAWALFRNGRSTEAAKMAGNALKSGNRNPGLLLRAGIIMCRTGQATVGRPLIEQALACPLSFGPVERKLAPEARNALAVRH
jgi:tetratricopeptide (TPR) repeat protein